MVCGAFTMNITLMNVWEYRRIRESSMADNATIGCLREKSPRGARFEVAHFWISREAMASSDTPSPGVHPLRFTHIS
jgi:hypothetical protein